MNQTQKRLMRILTLIGLIVLPLQLFAQTQTFGGIILDEENCKIEQSEVEITITHKETGKTYVTETDDNGKFRFTKAPVGEYTLVCNR